MNATMPYRSPSPTTRPLCHHWLRGLLVGLAIAAVGFLLIQAFDRWICQQRASAAQLDPAAVEVEIVNRPSSIVNRQSSMGNGQWTMDGFQIDASGPSNHGEAITVDLPNAQHQSNISVGGLGCCVFRSIDHAARYQRVPALVHMPEWMQQKRIPGGGYPEKVAKLIPQCAKDRGLPVPEYVQHTGGDMQFLRLALSTGRMVCVTYDGRDGVYYRGSIAHMVNLVHLSDKWAVILDNNNPGRYLWMTPAEFEARWKGNGGGWAVVLLAPPPPPVPVN